jgi:hypothetical protein
MTVSELIEELRRAPPNAYVTVGGEMVHGVIIVKGRRQSGYYNDRFSKSDKGRETAIKFLQYTELSTGEVVLSPI